MDQPKSNNNTISISMTSRKMNMITLNYKQMFFESYLEEEKII